MYMSGYMDPIHYNHVEDSQNYLLEQQHDFFFSTCCSSCFGLQPQEQSFGCEVEESTSLLQLVEGISTGTLLLITGSG